MCYDPLPFPKSAEDIRRVIPVKGGMQPGLLWRLFPRESCDEVRFNELVQEVCRFNEASKRYVLKNEGIEALCSSNDETMDEWNADDEMDLC